MELLKRKIKLRNNKLIKTAVGADDSVRPNFEEIVKGKNGISLVKLLLIIVLMIIVVVNVFILVGVALNISFDNDGLFNRVENKHITNEYRNIQDLNSWQLLTY